jgi:hypothetical protein
LRGCQVFRAFVVFDVTVEIAHPKEGDKIHLEIVRQVNQHFDEFNIE